MPPNIKDLLTKRIHYFMSDNAPTSMINLTTFQRPPSEGGKKLLDLKARHSAIELTKC